MTEPKQRVLIIGSGFIPGIKTCLWEDDVYPTTPDYNVVILNFRSLDKSKASKYCWANFVKLSDDIKRSLNSNGYVAAIVSEDSYISAVSDNGSPVNFDALTYLFPFIRVEREKTETMSPKGDAFKNYLSRLRAMGVQTLKFSLAQTAGWKVECGNIAETLEGKSLALVCANFHTTYETVRRSMGRREKVEKIGGVAGQAIFLPEIINISEEENISVILMDLGLSCVSEMPKWAKAIKSDTGLMYEQKISEANEKLLLVKSELEDLHKKLSEVESYKRLFIASGTELECMLKEAIERLGGVVVPSRYSQEEYILEHEGIDYLIEVKGNTKSISVGDIRQLIDYLLQVESDTGVKGKGILFGNAWRNLPISERDTKDRPWFPHRVRELAARDNIVLLSSWDFYRALMLVFDGKLDGAAVLKAITTSGGLEVLLSKMGL